MKTTNTFCKMKTFPISVKLMSIKSYINHHSYLLHKRKQNE